MSKIGQEKQVGVLVARTLAGVEEDVVHQHEAEVAYEEHLCVGAEVVDGECNYVDCSTCFRSSCISLMPDNNVQALVYIVR